MKIFDGIDVLTLKYSRVELLLNCCELKDSIIFAAGRMLIYICKISLRSLSKAWHITMFIEEIYSKSSPTKLDSVRINFSFFS